MVQRRRRNPAARAALALTALSLGTAGVAWLVFYRYGTSTRHARFAIGFLVLLTTFVTGPLGVAVSFLAIRRAPRRDALFDVSVAALVLSTVVTAACVPFAWRALS